MNNRRPLLIVEMFSLSTLLADDGDATEWVVDPTEKAVDDPTPKRTTARTLELWDNFMTEMVRINLR